MANRGKATRKEVVHKESVGAPRKIPNQLCTGVSATKELASLVTKQVPKHAAVEVTTVGLDSMKHL